jgi:3-oxoacyl-[acyl-carrier protein] reductase
MSIPLSLSGKIALISGGSRGIGAATVRMFSAAGAKVAFTYRSTRTQAEALAEECGPDMCYPMAADLNTPEAARSCIRQTVERFGRLDILIANHGVWPVADAPIDEMTDEQWRSTLSTNLDGVFGLVKYAVAQMKAQDRTSGATGHIVLISSTSGQRGEAFHSDYSATKGALISLVKSLAAELASHEIYVNCVAPGWVNTDMSAQALEDPKSGEEILRTIPLGRAGRPEEIAAPVLFLCTDYASFITGEIFNVNGGAVLVG